MTTSTQWAAVIAMAIVATATPPATAQNAARESFSVWGPGEAPNVMVPAKLTPEGRAALRPSRKAQTLPGPGRELLGGPLLAAEISYANRAYPEADIPIKLTIGAQQAYGAIKSRGIGQGKNTPGQWTMIGPSSANYPGVLSFSGADYTTSGRITALAIAPDCSGQGSRCRVWAAAAGGGVWRTDNALAGSGPSWTYVSSSFATNAIGALKYDAARGTLYAGTGEPNASGDSEAGMGIYKSTDGGDTWSALPGIAPAIGTFAGGPFANGRSISSITIDPRNASVMYVSTTRGVRGVSSVTGGATTNPPPALAPPFGLWKSTDGGVTFSFIWNGNGSIRGVNAMALDPGNPDIVYASAFQQGVWRSVNGGAFTNIFSPIAPSQNTDRAEFAVTTTGGKTRMYVGDGSTGSPAASIFRTDDAAATVPVFSNLTNVQSSNYCTGQCWYDNFVYSPPGYPDVVYLGGSFQYGEFGASSNGRAVLLSTDAGTTFTDMTWDASSDTTPNGLHPDHHALVTVPGNPLLFINGSDGGLMRSSGTVSNIAYQCSSRGLNAANLAKCQQLLSRVPSQLFNMNKGLSTLQFQSLSVNPFDAKHLMGGTQDNGTYETTGSAVVWPQIMYGDGGQSGFSASSGALRFNTFTGQANDANFRNGDPTKWVVITGAIFSSPESALFYPPIIADPSPAAGKTIFQGSQSVWRTQDWGGDQAYLEANCAEFTTSAADPNCGNFVRLGPNSLTAGALGSRAGGNVGALARTVSDNGTLWAATTTGRLFVAKNADAAAASVSFTRIDSTALNSPGRFISGIAVDPANANRAFVSYSGYNFNTPAQPGHVFEVNFNGTTATWTDLSTGIGDLPATGVAFDHITGDLYASSDFGVMRLASGTTSWVAAGAGLPYVEVAGLTIVPSARKLYAATHGRSAWGLTLP